MNQVQESVVFNALHDAEVKQVRTTVLAAAKRFLANPETLELLPAGARDSVMAALNACRPDLVGRAIRPYAVAFVRAGVSAGYWKLVDAINFLGDATGTAWQYLTQERREQYLAWAAEEAACVR